MLFAKFQDLLTSVTREENFKDFIIYGHVSHREANFCVEAPGTESRNRSFVI